MAGKNEMDLVSDVLEKMIDSQIANTEAMTTLKNAVDENNELLEKISSYFTNGFRQEIKNHVSEVSDERMEEVKEISSSMANLTKEMKTFKSIGFWVKLTVGFIASLSVLSITVYKVIDLLGN